MMRVLRSWLASALPLAMFLAYALPVLAATVEAPAAQDLRADGERVRQKGLPILLVVEQAGCHYCKVLDREIIQPLIAGGEYMDKKVILRRLDIVSELPIRDFDGKSITPSDLARRYGAHVTPTLLFLDSDGRELAPKMVGLGTLDFYWAYLDEAINSALAKLQPCKPGERSLAQKGAAPDVGLC